MFYDLSNSSSIPAKWWKSSRSNGGDECVEFGLVANDDSVLVRDSKFTTGPALRLRPQAARGLVAHVTAAGLLVASVN